MPLTQEQITNFATKAKAAGASDQQILLSIAKKQKQVAEQDRVNQAAQAGVLPPDKAFEMGADVGILENQKKTASAQAKSPIIDTVKQLLDQDTKGITGAAQIGDGIGNIPSNILDAVTGRKSQNTKNIYDQLQGLLSLENRDKLKGSGAISDFEFKVLQQAASKLGRNTSDTDFRKALDELYTNLGGKASGGLDASDEDLINKYKTKK